VLGVWLVGGSPNAARANAPPTCTGPTGPIQIPPGPGGLSALFQGTDPDGDPLTLGAPALPPGTILSSPVGATEPSPFLVIVDIPTPPPGTYLVTLSFTDPGGLSDSCGFVLQVGVADTDGDGVADDVDNCPLVANPGQENADGDALGDVCDADDDNDGVADGADNCPAVANANQLDNDGDGAGDACDADDDNDGVPDGADNCPFAANPGQQDADGDGLGDACDGDVDGDAVPNAADNCPLTPNADQADVDGDGVGNACDNDSDNDGVPNGSDACPLVPVAPGKDADGNGCPDVAADLATLISSLDLPRGVATSLLAKVNAALRSKTVTQAARHLTSFIHEVEQRRGHQIPPATADLLIAFATNAIENL
jgi:hypothetical protein